MLGEVGRKEWRRTGGLLLRCGLLTQLDIEALESHCLTYERWYEATEALKKTQLLILTPSGYPVQNPLLGIINKQSEQMRHFWSAFGMTPADRTRISVNMPEGNEDPFERWEKGRAG